MEELDKMMERIFAEKEARRHELAALPWPEKVRRVVEMQKRVAPILKARGIEIMVWDLSDEQV
jgi:hypothetical protein